MSAYLGDPPEKHLMDKSMRQHEIITEQIIRECLKFEDKDTDPIEGLYPPTEKKLLHRYYRYLAHILTQCFSGREGGYDVLNQTLSSCMVAIALGLEFNYS
ncbi:hypothetical protein R6Q57_005741 [Mikania cordata]